MIESMKCTISEDVFCKIIAFIGGEDNLIEKSCGGNYRIATLSDIQIEKDYKFKIEISFCNHIFHEEKILAVINKLIYSISLWRRVI